MNFFRWELGLTPCCLLSSPWHTVGDPALFVKWTEPRLPDPQVMVQPLLQHFQGQLQSLAHPVFTLFLRWLRLGGRGVECCYERLGWEGSRTCSVSHTHGASYGKAISLWWFLTRCFSPSFHGAQMWNTRKITATWWVHACLCSRWIGCLLQHSASPWVTLLIAVFPLDFTRFGSVPRCAGKETSREAQVQSKRNVSDKAAVHQGTLTILGALLRLPWGCMMCLT